MKFPKGAIGPLATSCLFAVVRGHNTFGRVAKAAHCSKGAAVKALYRLRDEGLVTWEPRKHGTIRATTGRFEKL